ncbi:hypothetical protein L211DRAFT_848536 [Terfezia boudieri ATCC MYA-4762]|uniref:CCHC-type domain-containing protein n=1 Tax=Terfezia boudieri ATCC MYA-4762 TaxID=1051890 RepID=A0A3N4LP56_9PEZI|nr:hypothetical protein L211DRAFT_848536 [Terfezia boudieri ATCC MYA-4762]
MTESTYAEYMKRVKKLVSELKEYGEKVKDEDMAYTVLMGLEEKYSPLVVTLTNMASQANPLTFSRVSEQILIEEQRLNQFISQIQKQDPNASNPLAYKSDTMYKGDLQQLAFIACTNPINYRQNPYPVRGMYRGRGGFPYIGQNRLTVSQATSSTVLHSTKLQQQDITHSWTQQQHTYASQRDMYRNLPWNKAPWQPQTTQVKQTQEQMDHLNQTYSREEKQCYACGQWGHTRKNCWQEHPELHLANRL